MNLVTRKVLIRCLRWSDWLEDRSTDANIGHKQRNGRCYWGTEDGRGLIRGRFKICSETEHEEKRTGSILRTGTSRALLDNIAACSCTVAIHMSGRRRVAMIQSFTFKNHAQIRCDTCLCDNGHVYSREENTIRLSNWIF